MTAPAISRGARDRALRRLIRAADTRAQRRFRRWLDAMERGDRTAARRTSASYQEAERLLDRLHGARYGNPDIIVTKCGRDR